MALLPKRPDVLIEADNRQGAKAPAATGQAIALGLAAILFGFGGIGTWAVTAPLASAVIAHGKVTVASNRKQIQHLEGGLVAAIHVRNDDYVKAGDVLVELDEKQARTKFVLARGAYLASFAAVARLAAERDEREALVFPDDLTSRARDEPELDNILSAQRRIFEARQREYRGQLTLSRQRIAQLREEIKGLTAEQGATQAMEGYAAEELDAQEELYKKQFTPRQKVLAAKREATQLSGHAGRLRAQIARAEKEIGETELSMIQLQVKIRTEVVKELREAEMKLFELREQSLAAQIALGRVKIRAPVSGYVVNCQVHTLGGVAKPGEVLLELVPDGDSLVIEAKVRPNDIQDLAPGLDADVRFPTFKQRTTPTLKGRLETVSADSLSEARSGEAYYLAYVRVSAEEFEKLGVKTVRPGIPAELLIKTRERTPVAYLAQPFTDSINRAFRER
jgi:HlyD family type I secretion membrane fusion protein